MNCKYCGCELVANEESEQICYKCKIDPSNRTKANDVQVKVGAEKRSDVAMRKSENENSTPLVDYKLDSNYKTAKNMSQIISFIGWILLIAGIVISIVGLNIGINLGVGARGGASSNIILSIINMLPGLVTAISGLFIITAGQLTRATLDNADYTREILNIAIKTIKVESA